MDVDDMDVDDIEEDMEDASAMAEDRDAAPNDGTNDDGAGSGGDDDGADADGAADDGDAADDGGDGDDGPETQWRANGPHVGHWITRSVLNDESKVNSFSIGKVVGYLGADESDYVDPDGVPRALWHVEYSSGELQGDSEDLEEWELLESAPRPTLAGFAASCAAATGIVDTPANPDRGGDAAEADAADGASEAAVASALPAAAPAPTAARIDDESEYERLRRERIAANQSFLRQLGFTGGDVGLADAKPKRKKRKEKETGLVCSLFRWFTGAGDASTAGTVAPVRTVRRPARGPARRRVGGHSPGKTPVVATEMYREDRAYRDALASVRREESEQTDARREKRKAGRAAAVMQHEASRAEARMVAMQRAAVSAERELLRLAREHKQPNVPRPQSLVSSLHVGRRDLERVGRGWLDRVSTTSYVPQVGDEVLYFAEGHSDDVRRRARRRTDAPEGAPREWWESRQPSWLHEKGAPNVLECVVAAVMPVFPDDLYDEKRQVLAKRLQKLSSHKQSAWFREPFLDAHYLKCVRSPMDFGTMLFNVEMGLYDHDDEDFPGEEDEEEAKEPLFSQHARLVFSNALAYNEDGSAVAAAAQALSEVFEASEAERIAELAAADAGSDEEEEPEEEVVKVKGRPGRKSAAFLAARAAAEKLAEEEAARVAAERAALREAIPRQPVELVLRLVPLYLYEQARALGPQGSDGGISWKLWRQFIVDPFSVQFRGDSEWLVPRRVVLAALKGAQGRTRFCAADGVARKLHRLEPADAHCEPHLPAWRGVQLVDDSPGAEKRPSRAQSRRSGKKDSGPAVVRHNVWEVMPLDDEDAVKPEDKAAAATTAMLEDGADATTATLEDGAAATAAKPEDDGAADATAAKPDDQAAAVKDEATDAAPAVGKADDVKAAEEQPAAAAAPDASEAAVPAVPDALEAAPAPEAVVASSNQMVDIFGDDDDDVVDDDVDDAGDDCEEDDAEEPASAAQESEAAAPSPSRKSGRRASTRSSAPAEAPEEEAPVAASRRRAVRGAADEPAAPAVTRRGRSVAVDDDGVDDETVGDLKRARSQTVPNAGAARSQTVPDSGGRVSRSRAAAVPEEPAPTRSSRSRAAAVPEEPAPTRSSRSRAAAVPEEPAPTRSSRSRAAAVPEEPAPTRSSRSRAAAVPEEPAPTRSSRSRAAAVPEEAAPTRSSRSRAAAVPEEAAPTRSSRSRAAAVPEEPAAIRSSRSRAAAAPEEPAASRRSLRGQKTDAVCEGPAEEDGRRGRNSNKGPADEASKDTGRRRAYDARRPATWTPEEAAAAAEAIAARPKRAPRTKKALGRAKTKAVVVAAPLVVVEVVEPALPQCEALSPALLLLAATPESLPRAEAMAMVDALDAVGGTEAGAAFWTLDDIEDRSTHVDSRAALPCCLCDVRDALRAGAYRRRAAVYDDVKRVYVNVALAADAKGPNSAHNSPVVQAARLVVQLAVALMDDAATAAARCLAEHERQLREPARGGGGASASSAIAALEAADAAEDGPASDADGGGADAGVEPQADEAVADAAEAPADAATAPGEAETAPAKTAPATPTAEAPTAEAPTAEAPTAEAPTAEAPTAEAPTAEAPTAEAPTALVVRFAEPADIAEVESEPVEDAELSTDVVELCARSWRPTAQDAARLLDVSRPCWQYYVRKIENVKTNTGVVIRENVKLAISAALATPRARDLGGIGAAAELHLALALYAGNAAGPCKATALRVLDLYGGWHLGASSSDPRDAVQFVRSGGAMVAVQVEAPARGGMRIRSGARFKHVRGEVITVGTVEHHDESTRKCTCRLQDGSTQLIRATQIAELLLAEMPARPLAPPPSKRRHGPAPPPEAARPMVAVTLKVGGTKLWCARDALELKNAIKAFNNAGKPPKPDHKKRKVPEATEGDDDYAPDHNDDEYESEEPRTKKMKK